MICKRNSAKGDTLLKDSTGYLGAVQVHHLRPLSVGVNILSSRKALPQGVAAVGWLKVIENVSEAYDILRFRDAGGGRGGDRETGATGEGPIPVSFRYAVSWIWS